MTLLAHRSALETDFRVHVGVTAALAELLPVQKTLIVVATSDRTQNDICECEYLFDHTG